MSWTDRYREEQKRLNAQEAAAARTNAMDNERRQVESRIVESLLDRIEREIVASFIHAANTPAGQVAGRPLTRTGSGLFGRKRMISRGARWDISSAQRLFMGGHDHLFIASDGTWGYFITDTYADDTGHASTYVEIGRDEDGWACPHPPYGRSVAIEDVAKWFVEGLARLGNRPDIKRFPGLVPEDLRAASEMILRRIETIAIEFMARHRIEPR